MPQKYCCAGGKLTGGGRGGSARAFVGFVTHDAAGWAQDAALEQISDSIKSCDCIPGTYVPISHRIRWKPSSPSHARQPANSLPASQAASQALGAASRAQPAQPSHATQPAQISHAATRPRSQPCFRKVLLKFMTIFFSHALYRWCGWLMCIDAYVLPGMLLVGLFG